MIAAFKLAGAAFIALAMVPDAALALSIRTVTVLDPIATPTITVTPNTPSTNAPVIEVTPKSPLTNAPVIEVTPNGPVVNVPVLDVGEDLTPIDADHPVYERPPTYFGDAVDQRPLELAVACVVTGTPVEFPDDLMLINQGAPLESGTTIKWKIKSVAEGYVQLNKQLPTGATVKAIGVLAGGVEAGKPCSAKII